MACSSFRKQNRLVSKGGHLPDDSPPRPPSKPGQNFSPVWGLSGQFPLALEQEASSLFLPFLRGTETETQIRIMTNFRSHSKLVAESELELTFPGAQPFFSYLSRVRIWEVARGQSNVHIRVLGTRQLCPSTGPKTHSFYVKKVGRQPLLQPDRKGLRAHGGGRQVEKLALTSHPVPFRRRLWEAFSR